MPTTDRAIRSGLIAGLAMTVGVLTLAGCSSEATSSDSDTASSVSTPAGSSSAGTGVSTVNVTLKKDGSDDVCEADTTSVPAGPVTFTVSNESATGVIEFELLQDQRILGEKENLVPGLAPVSFTVTLGGGAYQLYCPGAKTELQDFTVTGEAAAAPTGGIADVLADGAKGYQSYVTDRLNDLLDGAKTLQASVKAGDVEQAKKDYAAARQFYEKVESDVSGFVKPGSDPTDNSGNLDYLIDMRSSNLDPEVGWHGFHAIERDLWQGGAITDDTVSLADELVENVGLLVQLAPSLDFKAEDLANGAAGLLEEVQSGKVTGEEEEFSHLDLVDLAANVEGARQAFAYLKPGLTEIDSALVEQIEKEFTAVDDVMSQFRDATALGGYVAWDTATRDANATKLSQSVLALQEPMAQIAEKVATAGL